MTEQAVVFLDILGFGTYAIEDIDATVELIENYQTVLEHRLIDEKLHPPTSYPDDRLKKLAETYAVDSFSVFIPFSDSVFIVGDDLDMLVRQLSTFLLESFTLASHMFITAPDAKQPTVQEIRTVQIGKSGNVVTTESEELCFPLLFRGGIAFGEVRNLSVVGIISGKRIGIPNVAGPAVVRAVSLEKTARGPRLFCEHAFVNRLNLESRRYVRPVEDVYEILWPAFHYSEDEEASTEIYKFSELFKPAFTLWKAWSKKPFAGHYRALIRLLIRSTYAFIDGNPDRVNLTQFVDDQIMAEGIEIRKTTGSLERTFELAFPSD